LKVYSGLRRKAAELRGKERCPFICGMEDPENSTELESLSSSNSYSFSEDEGEALF